MYFDDLQLLRTIDEFERSGQTGPLINGIELLRELVGVEPVVDDSVYRTFVRELELAKGSGYLAYDLMPWTAPGMGGFDQVGGYNYLYYLRDLRLLLPGRDRARCRVFEREAPDPAEDDGSPVTRLTFDRIADILVPQYSPQRLAMFQETGGVPKELIPDLSDPKVGLHQFFDRFEGGAADRRVVREFLGAWLSQSLHSGPNADQEKELLPDLARQGWYVRDRRLVRGEPLQRAATAPLLGGDLLANLHPTIQTAARSEFRAGRRAAAIFEAFKAVEIRVRQMTGAELSGVRLMGKAFDTDEPQLRLNQRSGAADRDEQQGFALIFKGAMQGIRDPKAHAPFEETDERRALDYLGLASLLMRRLDDAEPQVPLTG